MPRNQRFVKPQPATAPAQTLSDLSNFELAAIRKYAAALEARLKDNRTCHRLQATLGELQEQCQDAIEAHASQNVADVQSGKVEARR